MTTLTILHTNDLHSELDQWSAVTSLITHQRQRAEKLGHDVLLFDIGDHCDRFHPLTEGLLGKGNIELLNDAAYTAATIGNNEGITLSRKELDSLYENAEFDVLLANLFYDSGGRPDWCRPWKLYELSEGRTAAVFGVTIPFYAFYEELGWHVTDPIKAIGDILPEMEKEADLIIGLSHLGLRLDEQTAEKFPQIDLLLGAHTHHVLSGGRKVDHTWIHQCGRSGSHVGEVTVNMEEVAEIAYIQTHKVDNSRRDASTEAKLYDIEKRALVYMEEEITDIPYKMDVSWYGPSSLNQLLAEGLREWCGADIAMVNAGLLLNGLPQGSITRKHIHEICPHPINPAKVTMSGSDIARLMRQSSDNTMIHYALKGYGFRGKVLGFPVFTGKDWTADTLEKIKEAGREMDAESYYSVAVPDLYTFSHLYPFITDLRSTSYYMPEFLRDVLTWKLRKT
ncbi:MAG: bifunctional metallophosphatase/5'-nucleotidase [Alkalicoccus sp.]|nr:MAG: bifunctional metallophosphatase/5'-nucleotidase [Alkalicoccus sp.]